MQLNVEGLSKAKADVLRRILDEEKIDILAIQETHTHGQDQLMKILTIPAYSIAGATYHTKYGTATYVKNDLSFNLIKSSDDNNIFSIVTQIGNLYVNNIYKPPATEWPTFALSSIKYPAIYIGDFNSHHTSWGYRANNTCGDKLVEWSEAEGVKLIHDAKQKGTFHSARWNRVYNPDLCFLSTESNGASLPTQRRVLGDFPNSQHRPVVIEVGYQIQTIKSIPKPRWNF